MAEEVFGDGRFLSARLKWRLGSVAGALASAPGILEVAHFLVWDHDPFQENDFGGDGSATGLEFAD